ncbi:MAG: hypothetical protein AB8H86_17210 [Polyangiales bacterium]
MGQTNQLTLQDRWAIYETSVVLAWADGRLSAEEVQAARVVAEELSLNGPFSLAGATLRLMPTDIPDVPEEIADLAYATAVWMAYADGLHRRESIFLARLQRRLGIDSQTAAQTMRHVRQLHERHSRRDSLRALHAQTRLPVSVTRPQRPSL